MVFNHSVKPPTQYRKAAAIFRRAANEKKSVKTLVFEERHAKIPNLLALLNKYSANKGAIEAAIEGTKILSENPRLDPSLCRVLVTELIFGTKALKGESKPVCCVRSYAEKLQEFVQSDGANCQEPGYKPRYVRINTNLLSLNDAFEFLAQEEWRRIEKVFESYDEYLQNIKNLEEDQYLVDMHIPDLLVFHSTQKSYWAQHEYVKDKKFLLQDKATCIVGHFLNPEKNSKIMDMCAAPGMKTIHLSNIINNEGTIFAIERDERRYKTLTEMVKKANATSVRPINCDALLLTDQKKFLDVEYILVDPSCSGSGIQNRISLTNHDKNDEERLKKLAYLQVKLLTHAMSGFPKVKRVVYSTCSLNEEENEQVVEKSLRKCPNFKLLNGKKLLQRKWKNVGNKEYEGIGKNCIYARPDLDYTDGMFIAVFARINYED